MSKIRQLGLRHPKTGILDSCWIGNPGSDHAGKRPNPTPEPGEGESQPSLRIMAPSRRRKCNRAGKLDLFGERFAFRAAMSDDSCRLPENRYLLVFHSIVALFTVPAPLRFFSGILGLVSPAGGTSTGDIETPIQITGLLVWRKLEFLSALDADDKLRIHGSHLFTSRSRSSQAALSEEPWVI